MKILLIEDEKIIRVTLTDAIRKKGHTVTVCETGLQGLDFFKNDDFDVVITDLKLPKISGLEVLQAVQNSGKNVQVILMTAYGTVNSAVEALKMGAYDYLTKPFSYDELLITLNKIDEHRQILKENIQLKKELNAQFNKTFIGTSPAVKKLLDVIESVADSDHTILIQGESGTGKEVMATALHRQSSRKNGPFVKVSCAALSESLLESELFGHEKGAFTGAIKDRKGRFEKANGGTIFLDDIDDMPLSMQVKLLRVLQEREIERVGSSQVISIDVRVICATKVELLERTKSGEFRDDLYYRLNVIPLIIPPLKERKEDIPLLAEFFIRKHGQRKNISGVTPQAMQVLANYGWPGNVRELENIIERMIAMSKSELIGENELPEIVTQASSGNHDIFNWDYLENNLQPMDQLLAFFEKKLLQWALKKAEYNQTNAATLLAISRTTLRSKLEKYDLLN